MSSESLDLQLRAEIMEFLRHASNDQEHPIAKSSLLYDFKFNGAPFKIIDHQGGIRKPTGFTRAISLTTYESNEKFGYADGIGPDGFIRYSWQGESFDDYRNKAVRQLIGTDLGVPWFIKVSDREFQPVFPLRVVGEEPENKQFVLAFEDIAPIFQSGSPIETALRAYVTRQTISRVHQRFFRSQVLSAYNDHCAICKLHHRKLLDAAHIIPDSGGGEPSVVNGLSLCKIHHQAFDENMLGITPDYLVKIRKDILDEDDGPMLEHGLKRLHNGKLMYLPSSNKLRPSRDLLSSRYNEFLSA
ncbi:HNH endonuclease [Tsukamurella paurometabola]|uniref:HNH nuclease domain-containing protein n=1 Tax=Tsukamurella paurometabola TaxID=2061 RepID=A0A3P8LA36_TSUPA|nr:HNH endonuclease [Tsukamurella paurometabola]UEA84209.1 HNH endonuclease [Tsukamurella paurometabola]VDR41381.1 Uncharacterised protein [Tsukamurella paurometabola]